MVDEQTDQALRIFAWIVPRVNSTALTKCMGNVDDTVVWMEPYNMCSLNATIYNPDFKKGYPPAEKMRADLKEYMEDENVQKILEDCMERTARNPNLYPQEEFTYQFVKENLEVPEPTKKFIFIKDHAFAITDHLDCLPENVPTKHAFLIRHPQEVYASLKNVLTAQFPMREPKQWEEFRAADEACYMPVQDIYQHQFKLWKYVRENLDPDPIILDTYDLISHPDAILPKVFEKWSIPFKKSYLKWNADPEAVFSSWKGSPVAIIQASHSPWTSRALQCTQFDPPRYPRGVSRPEWKITDDLKEYIAGAMPFYEEMYANRLL